MVVDCSTDGGDTWNVEETPVPPSNVGTPMESPVFDEAGNLYLASGHDGNISYASRTADGWGALHSINPEGHHRMPWIAAGRDGALGAAWYGTLDETIGPDTEWYVFAAASRNAADDEPQWDWVIADPEPVFIGELGRDLLDFLQIDMGPDGALHIAYSKQRPGQGPDGNEEQLHYVRSEPSPLAMDDFWYGPA